MNDAEATPRKPISFRQLAGKVRHSALGLIGLRQQPDTSSINWNYYQRRHPDLAGLSREQLEEHWLSFGMNEERPTTPLIDQIVTPSQYSLDPNNDTVFLLLHDAGRSGAPILGWNLAKHLSQRHNVITIVQRPGDIFPQLEEVSTAIIPLFGAEWDQVELRFAAEKLKEMFHPQFAIANSANTHPVAIALERAKVPVIGLVHEFAGNLRGPGGPLLGEFFDTVTEVVFPTQIVADSALAHHPEMRARGYRVLPQGATERPPAVNSQKTPTELRKRSLPSDLATARLNLPANDVNEFLANLNDDTCLVIGVGQVTARKGVDLFVQAATYLQTHFPDSKVRFAWIGEQSDYLYADQILEQLNRSIPPDAVEFLAPAPELLGLYERANIFFLSSRLDPLPNVAIEAALLGVPVVAFDQAGGISQWLTSNERLSHLVVPYQDAAVAANLIADLAADDDERLELGMVLKELGNKTFDMPRYVEELERLGVEVAAVRAQRNDDVGTILASGNFRPDVFADPEVELPTEELIEKFVSSWSLASPWTYPRKGFLPLRRPSSGFQPLVYAERYAGFEPLRDGNPFAHYLKSGKPAGPWQLPVICPEEPTTASSDLSNAKGLKVLVHGHYHYLELVSELIQHLKVNQTPRELTTFDLLITTNTTEKAQQISSLLDSSDIRHLPVEVFPNLGRNFGPLLTGLETRVLEYDLFLHVHGKQSPQTGTAFANQWSSFLLENLVGGQHAMLDRIITEFANDPNLGLVYPDDPYLNSWEENRLVAAELAQRIGISVPQVTHFDYPVGGMFWARPQALQPLIAAGIGWDEYPPEPLPHDGTMLHALERLIPFIVEQSGYTIAKTRVPGVNR